MKSVFTLFNAKIRPNGQYTEGEGAYKPVYRLNCTIQTVEKCPVYRHSDCQIFSQVYVVKDSWAPLRTSFNDCLQSMVEVTRLPTVGLADAEDRVQRVEELNTLW